MKPTLLRLLLFLFSVLSFAQTEGARMVVPGTHCTLIPPVPFLPAEGLAGFSNAKAGAAITVIDIDIPVLEMTAAFAPKQEGKNFMNLKRTDTLVVERRKTFIRVYTKKTNGKNIEA